MYRDTDCCWPSTQELALRCNEFEAVLGHLGTNPQLAVEDKKLESEERNQPWVFE